MYCTRKEKIESLTINHKRPPEGKETVQGQIENHKSQANLALCIFTLKANSLVAFVNTWNTIPVASVHTTQILLCIVSGNLQFAY